jgi:hypothetical protein
MSIQQYSIRVYYLISRNAKLSRIVPTRYLSFPPGSKSAANATVPATSIVLLVDPDFSLVACTDIAFPQGGILERNVSESIRPCVEDRSRLQGRQPRNGFP